MAARRPAGALTALPSGYLAAQARHRAYPLLYPPPDRPPYYYSYALATPVLAPEPRTSAPDFAALLLEWRYTMAVTRASSFVTIYGTA